MMIGVLGGGQLGRMLALAGHPLGLRFRFFDTAPDAPAGAVGELVVGDYTDTQALSGFAAGLDVVTYEFENVPAAAARWLAERLPVFPPPQALETAQDRLAEKTLFSRLGIPTPAFAPVDSRGDLEQAAARIGLPAVLKTRRGGYDGKGQYVLRERSDLDAAWSELGGRPLILEAFVPFDREVSVLAVRGRDGRVAVYPLVQNTHEGGILRRSIAPAPGVPGGVAADAERHVGAVLNELGYVGVLAIEFFDAGGRLLANEMAPRVHNSGHWTIEGAECSQFENHLRAVAGLPLGPATPVGSSVMLNLIGSVPPVGEMLRIPGSHLHLYGKAPRPGRKIGHLTIRSFDGTALRQAVSQAEAMIRSGG